MWFLQIVIIKNIISFCVCFSVIVVKCAEILHSFRRTFPFSFCLFLPFYFESSFSVSSLLFFICYLENKPVDSRAACTRRVARFVAAVSHLSWPRYTDHCHNTLALPPLSCSFTCSLAHSLVHLSQQLDKHSLWCVCVCVCVFSAEPWLCGTLVVTSR